jgi:F-type H+-transporting ATPase subunit a
MFASGFSWFRLIPAVDKDTVLESAGIAEHSVLAGHEIANTTVHLHAWLATLGLVVFAFAARAALEAAKRRGGLEQYYPTGKADLLGMAEMLATGIRGLIGDLLTPKDARLYILACNIQSILPGFLPPTDNINTNVGMAVLVFCTFVVVGLSRDAVGFIKHLAGPALFLAPLMFPIELVSLAIRPVSLTVRLTANLYGDHQVFTILSNILPLGLPAALLALACLVSVVQAFVFSLLTVIYIHLSLPHHEHDADHGAHAH